MLTTDGPVLPEEVRVSVCETGMGCSDARQSAGGAPVQESGHHCPVVQCLLMKLRLFRSQLLSEETGTGVLAYLATTVWIIGSHWAIPSQILRWTKYEVG